MSNFDSFKAIEHGIAKRGFSFVALDQTIHYTVGMCDGEKNGYEFVSVGLDTKLAMKIFRLLRSSILQIKGYLEQAEKDGLNTLIFDDFLTYTDKNGKHVKGPLTLALVTPENQRGIVKMPVEFYGHSDFKTYQCLICDSNGKGAFQKDYDMSLIETQIPLFLNVSDLKKMTRK